MGFAHRKPMQRGMTLVELMVGLAVGLIVVVTALGLAAGQLREDRSLLKESRLTIALETAADAVSHDLRRSGYRGDAGAGIARSASAATGNPYAGVSWSESTATLAVAYSLDDTENGVVDGIENFRFRLNAGAIETKIGNGSWQAVTDTATLTVTRFSITPVLQETPLGSFCEQPCPATQAGCPRHQSWRYDIVMAGRLVADATVSRELRTSVRVRNDVVTGACPV